ncbi:hypothetical protein D3C73_1182810 [compost metagenome]
MGIGFELMHSNQGQWTVMGGRRADYVRISQRLLHSVDGLDRQRKLNGQALGQSDTFGQATGKYPDLPQISDSGHRLGMRCGLSPSTDHRQIESLPRAELVRRQGTHGTGTNRRQGCTVNHG